MEPAIDGIGKRALAAAGETGEPEDTPPVTCRTFPVFATHGMVMPTDVDLLLCHAFLPIIRG
jgi:hypothetical protein